MHAAIVASSCTLSLVSVRRMNSGRDVFGQCAVRRHRRKIMDRDAAGHSLNSVLTNSQVVANLPPNDG